jgi:signal transduction histidine kinase/ActR/RegA family two-component response regulator
MRIKYIASSFDNTAAFYAGFAALAALMLAIFLFVSRQIQHYEDARHIVRERQILYKVYIDLLDAETGQRGYLLTNDKSYLGPYDTAIARLDADLKDLSEAPDGINGELGETKALRAWADEKLTELRSTVELHDAGRHDQAMAVVNDGVGRAIMERFRASIDGVVQRQQQRLEVEFSAAAREGNILRLGALAAVLFTIAVGFLSITRLRNELSETASARDSLRDANAALVNEAAERSKLAEQLRQSQKMEAIGQLSGGLAHDFNNMLSVILGGVELAKRGLAKAGGNPERYLDAAVAGVERAAALTHRLLAFSRQQPLSPEPIDPNTMVSEMAELLARTLGGAVKLETVLAGGLWRTNADSGELESAILNLAINARDAMPEGGRLTIETSNAFLDEDYAARQIGVPSGQYVLIAISDTGTGMSPELIERAFEPFFTTKPTGQGTGLGLSQVYGFVRQSGGHVKIYSEPGHGTTIKIYLPRHYGPTEPQDAPPALVALDAGDVNETILLVEDEERVRQLAADTLTRLGYHVLQAGCAREALRQLERNAKVDLLFTDIVMPDKNGRELADEARRLRPGLRVLFTTGYTRNAIVHNGILDAGVNLIVKPYSIDKLARKLREVLDSRETAE